MSRMRGSQKTYSANPSNYKLLEEVGYGASATVYRAIYIPFNEVVAVKCLDLDRCNSNLVCALPVFCRGLMFLELLAFLPCSFGVDEFWLDNLRWRLRVDSDFN